VCGGTEGNGSTLPMVRSPKTASVTHEAIPPVIFNEPGEPVLLGAVTLEVLLLGVDPAGQRLFPVEGLRVSCYDL